MEKLIRSGICHQQHGNYCNVFSVINEGKLVRTIRTGFVYLSPKAADVDAEKSTKHFDNTGLFRQFI